MAHTKGGYARSALFGCMVLAVLFLAGRHNLQALARLHAAIPADLAPVTVDLQGRCSEARGLYNEASDYRQVVDVLLDAWMAAPDNAVKVAHCRSAALELAASLQLLRRPAEAMSVYQRAIDLSPAARDGVTHFAELALGDAALQAGDWQTAGERYTVAYDSSLAVATESEVAYEERAWQRLATMADRVGTQGALNAVLPATTQTGELSTPGQQVLRGLLLERAGDAEAARQAYQAARSLAPHAQFLAHYLATWAGAAAGSKPTS